MKSENTRIAKNTTYLYVRNILVMLISLYTSRVVLQSLGVIDLGIYNVVGGVVTILSFINGAMSSATLRFITFELGKEDSAKLKKVFCMSIQIHLVIALLVFFFAETIGLWFLLNKMTIPVERLHAAQIVYQFSIFTSIIGIMNAPYDSLLIAHERMSTFAYISILRATLTLLAAISIGYIIYDRLIIYALLMFCVYLIIIAIYQIYCKIHYPESHYSVVRSKELALDMSKYAFWTLFSNFAYATYTQGINILLNVFFNPAVNAARAIAVQVQMAINKFIEGFQSAINPQITKSYAADNRERLLLLIDTSGRFSFYLVLLFAFPIIVGLDELLQLWLGTVPEHTANFIRINMLCTPFGVLLNPLNIATQATGRIRRYAFVTGLMQLMILPLSYVALVIWSVPEVTYWVYLAVTCMVFFVYMYLTCYEIRLSMWYYFKRVVVKCFFVAIVASMIPFVSHYELACPTILNMVIAELSVLVSIYYVGLRPNEKKIFLSIIMQKFQMLSRGRENNI